MLWSNDKPEKVKTNDDDLILLAASDQSLMTYIAMVAIKTRPALTRLGMIDRSNNVANVAPTPAPILNIIEPPNSTRRECADPLLYFIIKNTAYANTIRVNVPNMIPPINCMSILAMTSMFQGTTIRLVHKKPMSASVMGTLRGGK